MARMLRPRASSAGISPTIPLPVMNVCSRAAQEQLYDLIVADPDGVRTILSLVVSFSDTANIDKIRKLFEHEEHASLAPRLEMVEETSRTCHISGIWHTTFPLLKNLTETCHILHVWTEEEAWEEIGWTKPLHIALTTPTRLFLALAGISPLSARVVLWQALRKTERAARREMDAYHRREQQVLHQGDLLDYPPPPDAYELARLRRHAELMHEVQQIKNCRNRIRQSRTVLWEAAYTRNKTSLLFLVKNTRTLPSVL